MHTYSYELSIAHSYYLDCYKICYLGKGFSAIPIAAIALTSWDHLEKIGIFQKCKVHLYILKGFRTADHQSWNILRVVQESNPGCAGHIDFIGPSLSPGRREMCANFDKLQFLSPLRYRDVFYIFGNLQSISKWSQLVRTIAALGIPEKSIPKIAGFEIVYLVAVCNPKFIAV